MPAGRQRGIAYAGQIPSYISNYRIRPIRDDYLRFTYESLLELKDVEIGLISSNLVNSSIVKKSVTDDSYCTVCQYTVLLGIIIRELKCKHSFHINCIEKWLISHNSCPDCRVKL